MFKVGDLVECSPKYAYKYLITTPSVPCIVCKTYADGIMYIATLKNPDTRYSVDSSYFIYTQIQTEVDNVFADF